MLYSELSPVQFYYLANLKKAKIQNVLAFIFRKLIFSRVLNLKKMFIYPDALSKRTQKYFKLVKGENFYNYDSSQEERYVINLIKAYGLAQPKKISDSIIKKFKMPGKFISKVIEQRIKESKYIKVSKMTGSVKRTQLGKEKLGEFNDYMQGVEQMFKSLIDANAEYNDFIVGLLEVDVYLFFIEMFNPDLFATIIAKTKEIHSLKLSEYSLQLQPFMEAINLDLSYFEK